MDYSFQMYSARNEASLDETLKTLASLGYKQVEGWGGQFADPAALAQSLKSAGLIMPTAHMGYAQLEDTDAALKIVDQVGIETVYCPAPPSEEFRTGSGDWAGFAQGLARIAAAFKAAGKGFGYHNHHWEFSKDADGKTPMELILDASPDMQWEMDLAWVVKADEDPVAWMDKLGSRITSVHVKDIAAAGENADEDGWADVGHGTLDWKKLIADAQSKTKARYFVLEHDKPSDAIRFARRSMDTLKSFGA
ncbi:Sugar phosphate isomerase/epimerase [Devosia crocina]|uniref:Sugar phosphate isomerase/epimerase n=1 Tax=Devosia crocina TaxID=429728 RepID=A0A1I7NEJ4_9HYPH|nr:sugar phosphate isomerase/epimerase [Devosia crocina]SFV33082.1 Sugar phosphate isomerase/epimerase [Devosia crocina]